MRRIPFRPNNQIALINMISRTVFLFISPQGVVRSSLALGY